ncbi:hypothetical protein DPMN_194087 [Dreissena polymorpha]|uniref:Uncharacterized protein n=1 Tax=Dreissena polymorpha TaxID=45954 RepID=A0A9D3Y1X0_DREPO|nr:hypothetical protein DPMN_194087 [Dreissena polymorpha]
MLMMNTHHVTMTNRLVHCRLNPPNHVDDDSLEHSSRDYDLAPDNPLDGLEALWGRCAVPIRDELALPVDEGIKAYSSVHGVVCSDQLRYAAMDDMEDVWGN